MEGRYDPTLVAKMMRGDGRREEGIIRLFRAENQPAWRVPAAAGNWFRFVRCAQTFGRVFASRTKSRRPAKEGPATDGKGTAGKEGTNESAEIVTCGECL